MQNEERQITFNDIPEVLSEILKDSIFLTSLWN